MNDHDDQPNRHQPQQPSTPPRAPQYQPPHQHQAPQQHQPRQSVQQARPPAFNVFGVLAISVVALYAAYSLIQPFLLRQAMDSGTLVAVSAFTGILMFVSTLTGVALAIVGLVQKSKPRGRWLAWVALGAAGGFILQWTFTTLGNWLAFQLLPY